MIRVTDRCRHHSHAQVVAALLETLAVADECELTGDDRTLLLAGIFNMVSAHHVAMEQVQIDALGMLGAQAPGSV